LIPNSTAENKKEQKEEKMEGKGVEENGGWRWRWGGGGSGTLSTLTLHD
jgi:hypothetical protein